MRRFLPVLLFLVTVAMAPAFGGDEPRVLLIGADTDYGISSIHDYLTDLNTFAVIDTFDAWHGTPSPDLLSNYCCVLAWSNTAFQDAALLGDRLADFVDRGGGAVLASMAMMGGSPVEIHGRILDYAPLVGTGGNAFKMADLGTYLPWHSIMTDVEELSAYYRDKTAVTPGAMLVAEWSDGLPLVAVNAERTVVGIACFPNDQDGIISGDYPMLFGNALNYLCTIPEPGMVTLFGLLLGVAVLLKRR